MKKKISKEKPPVLIILKALLLTKHPVTCVGIREGLISQVTFEQGAKGVTHVVIWEDSRQRDLCAKALRQELSRSVQSHVAGEEQGKERRTGQVCMCTVLYSPMGSGERGQSRLEAEQCLDFDFVSGVKWGGRQRRQLKY